MKKKEMDWARFELAASTILANRLIRLLGS